MKILLLSDTFSEHTEKWALGLANNGAEIGIFSFNRASYEWYNHPKITVFFEPERSINAESTLTKLAYLKYVTVLKKIIKHFKPDILHAHYATSYGLVGALSNFHPFIISSWGTDVMKFPNKNFVAKSILKYNYRKADVLCATSPTISDCIKDVITKDVTVVPFGVDINNFSPRKVSSLFHENDFVLGSIKPLETLYNIDILIDSFITLRHKYPTLKLLIVGSGASELELKEKVRKAEINDFVIFTGRIPFNEVSNYYNMIDVLVNISEYESFGVSVIEAMACEKPVVVTNVGGLKDIVKDDTLGLKVEVRNIEQTVKAIEELITDKDKYKKIAANSRAHVVENYNWFTNLKQMESIYAHALKIKTSES
jgi:L-malate glycosyltransferase